MSVLEMALRMLEKYPLCDHCLGRQFALLGRGTENSERGKTLKLALTMQASIPALKKDAESSRLLRVLASNGFSSTAEETLRQYGKCGQRNKPSTCFLCDSTFRNLDEIVNKIFNSLGCYEYASFLVGVELPVVVEEREDEFKAEFDAGYSENVRHEFARLLGKRIEAVSGKTVEFGEPDITVVVNPWTQKVMLQVNPIFIAGSYRKLVRDIPQSKWYCSHCWGKGCEKCGGTGKMYPESVEELVSKPFLDSAQGEKTAFHASGREDIDAKMLGTGRPFVVEISKPLKRLLNLEKLEKAVNIAGAGKVEISRLRFTNRGFVRTLKKAESAQKEYRVLVEFGRDVSENELKVMAVSLSCSSIKQRTPLRVVHRRADLIREKYIYWFKVKKVARKQADLKIRCQGGLYVKELVSGDEGRTTPSVSALLDTGAKALKLDVLKVIVDL